MVPFDSCLCLTQFSVIVSPLMLMQNFCRAPVRTGTSCSSTRSLRGPTTRTASSAAIVKRVSELRGNADSFPLPLLRPPQSNFHAHVHSFVWWLPRAMTALKFKWQPSRGACEQASTCSTRSTTASKSPFSTQWSYFCVTHALLILLIGFL